MKMDNLSINYIGHLNEIVSWIFGSMILYVICRAIFEILSEVLQKGKRDNDHRTIRSMDRDIRCSSHSDHYRRSDSLQGILNHETTKRKTPEES